MKQNSNFLSIKQAKEFLSRLLHTELDDKEFFIYCFENNIPIVQKALTEFSVIKGFAITQFEADEFYRLTDYERNYDPEEAECIYQNCNFQKRVEEIRSRIYQKIRREEYKIKKEKVLKELKYSQYTHEEKLKFVEKEVRAYAEVRDIIENIMNSDSEYIEICSKEEVLNRLSLIKESILVKKINGKNYAFSDKNIEIFLSGTYIFLDEDLSSDYDVLCKIQGDYGLSIPSKISNFLFIKDEIYLKYGRNNKEIYNTNSSLIEGILQEGFLKSDFENSIKSIESTELKSQDIQIENKYLCLIGALLEERKRAAGGKRIQSLVAQNIEDMTKGTDAMLSKSTLEKIFSSANKVFKPFNNN
ncbi:hypothetical protein [Acinetobacter vivianii]|uniref:hypothetical protein n=1 Tax=Acinetobacter vivianii TaxID=1776742 RepID=UPI00404164FD